MSFDTWTLTLTPTEGAAAPTIDLNTILTLIMMALMLSVVTEAI